ncbi:MAG: HipA domain-containing protein [Paracoccaceae bacterium]|nr:HipA domain-containing protein [Paracoccaceae bacterium]
MLHLVGETIDKHRVQYGVETGRLVQIMRGIYVAAEDNADAVLFDHALRIAAYLYPNTYLCGFSAERLAPTPDRCLFLSGRRNARTRLRDLEIVQTRAPDAPETETAQIADPMGDLRVRRSTRRFRYLESFRRRSEAGAAMPFDMKVDIAARLVEAAGGQREAIIECWRLGEANGWREEAGRAEQLIARPLREVSPPRAGLHVGWHGEKIGLLSHDGSAWRWEPSAAEGATPVRTGLPGRLPPFIESLLPEGWLERVLNPKSERERMSGKRYMSNMVVSGDEGDIRTLPADVLEGRLETFAKKGKFAGGYAGPMPSFDETLEDRMAGLYAAVATPRLSGVQIKAPMNLSLDGMLRPAGEQRAFTHILKPSPGAGFEELPRVEAACLAAAHACGFETAAHAIVSMPGDLPDALLVERFDIRRDRNDRRKIAMEDIASVRGVAPSEKYEGSIEQVARELRGVSSDAEADIEVLLRRAIFAWLIADGDFHLKNMAVLKVAPDGIQDFSSVRFAPTYDALTTRVFPGFERDDLALSLAGKRNRLTSGDFVRAGATMGIDGHLARDCVESLCVRLGTHLESLEPASGRVGRALEIWRQRIETIAG